MKADEERIQHIEKDWIYPENPELEPITLALCEIARQLARIADLHKFELGLSEDNEENDECDEEETRPGESP